MIKILPHERPDILSKYSHIIDDVQCIKNTGHVERIIGLTIESIGPDVRYGDVCRIATDDDSYIFAEVVGFRAKNTPILMPIGEMRGVVPGAQVTSGGAALMTPVGPELLGRVIDGIGRPMDGKGSIFSKTKYPVDGKPINPLDRTIIERPLSTGIRSIDSLMTVGRGQRIGIFAGSGVGKSSVLSMIARYTDADINVIALIGERGREVKDFVEKDLGPEGLKRSVVVVATSDQPPMMRIRGAYLAHTIAEYFRDQGRDVNLLLDSITRFAMAQREVGLSAGEPVASRGYPASVFTLMPKMLERAGTSDKGSVTGFYTVLVEADDMNDPIGDAVRGILDGHIVLDRTIANKGHYPAVDCLASLSRCMKDVVSDEHKKLALEMRELLAAYKEVEDMVLLGTYVRGSNHTADRAIAMIGRINEFLKQGLYEKSDLEITVERMKELLHGDEKTHTRKSDYVSSNRVPSFVGRPVRK
jgi:flagellum-specific ATP synthase